MKKHAFLCLVAALLLNSSLFSKGPDTNFVKGKIYFKLKDSSPVKDYSYAGGSTDGLPKVLAELVKTFNVTAIKRPFIEAKSAKLDRIFSLSFTDPKDLPKVIRAVASMPGIEYAEPIPVDRLFCTADPVWSNPVTDYYHLNLVQACAAWAAFPTGAVVRVAILDNECDINHPDLSGKVMPADAYDIADGDPNVIGPNATFNHGTHVTGIVGAKSDLNGTVGLGGVNTNLQLMFGKIAQDGTGFLTDGYTGMVWAVNNGANVINCSWGNAEFFSITNSLVTAWVISQDVIIVAAAGNNNINAPAFPASFPGVYSVAASDQTDTKTSFSNWGPTVDISAPGDAIYSTISSVVGGPGAYANFSGTSMASPMVAALAGLIRSNNPSYTAAQVLNCISSTTDPVISGVPVGPGRINAYEALKCSSGASDYVQFKVSTDRICAGNSVTFGDISMTSSPIVNWDWTISSMTNTLTATGSNPSVSFPAPGIYHAVLTVTCASTQTFTSYYPTTINVIGINTAAFSSTGSFCKNGGDAMISLTMDAWPELIMNYDINGVPAPTMTVVNQYNGIFDLVLATPNAPTMTVKITNISDGILSCPVGIGMTAPLVDCCPNLVPNGNFEAGNVNFGADLSICGVISPGYGTTMLYGTPQRGLVYYHTDGTAGANSSYTPACAPAPAIPAPGVGSSHYKNTVNLIGGSDYIFSFVFANPNQQYISWYQPWNYIFPASIFRVSLVDPSSISVFTQTWTPNATTTGNWIQFKQDLTGLISTTGSYSLNVEQIVNFDGIAYDYNWDDFSVTAINTLTSSITPSLTALCATGNASMTVNSGNAQPTLTYTWTSSPAGSYPNTAGINPSVSATTVYTATITDGNFCTVSATSTVTVGSPTVTVSNQTICAGTSATLTASGATTYTWQPGGLIGNPVVVTPSVTTTYTVTGTTAGCTNSTTAVVTASNCASTCTNCIVIGVGGVITPVTLTGNTYCINNNVTISGAVNISGCEIKMAPNVIVTIAPGAFFNVTNTHIYSCTDMWQGMVIQNGGGVSLRNSLVEDAITAVNIPNNTQTSGVLTVFSSTFNKNYKGIVISNYAQAIPTFPFTIKTSVFTCRNIKFTPNSLVFPPTTTIGAAASNPGAPFTNPYISNSGYPEFTPVLSYLKAPFAGLKSNVGIELTKVGTTLNPQSTSPTYYEFSIGDSGGNNIFDNQSYGINATNANLSSFNNVFQNSIATAGVSDGIGINSNSTNNDNYRLRVTSATAATPAQGNQFVDCSRDINTGNVFEHEITYNDFRSSQVNTAAPATFVNIRGNYGVKSITNRYRLYNVSNNTMYNLENAVLMEATYGPLSIPTVPATGQYAGKIDVDNNTISAQIGAAPVTTQYVSNAVVLSNTVGGTIIPSTPFPNVPVARTTNNKMTNVYRGVIYNTWTKINSTITFNDIRLVSDPYNAAGLPVQFGIWLNTSQPSTNVNLITGNQVTGFTITNRNLYGIVTNKSFNTTVSCNKTNTTYSGIEFQGGCSGTIFTNNIMSNHTYGFVLSNSGFIGVQGSTTVPSDNMWTGTWPAGTFKTATIGSTAIGSELWVRGTSGPTYNPNGSGFTSSGYGTNDYYYVPGNTGTIKFITTNPAQAQCPNNPGNVIPPSFRMAGSGDESGDEAGLSVAGFDVLIYPNPGSNEFNLSVNGMEDMDLDISISDMTGKIVYENKHHVSNALTHFEIDVANGVYTVKINDSRAKQLLIKKLVVQK